MTTSFIRPLMLAAALLAPLPALAQETEAAAPAEVSAEQVQQLVTTLRQRNDQVRTLSDRVRELEAAVTRAEGFETRLKSAEQALTIASQKNQALVAIGEEIITGYENQSLGRRSLSTEPFTQLYRVKLENELQDYRDKIAQLGFYPEREMQPAAVPAGN